MWPANFRFSCPAMAWSEPHWDWVPNITATRSSGGFGSPCYT